jgi:UDP-N-acetylmuramate--alanine ligase
MEEFSTAFNDADSLFVLDIYAASEQPIEGVTGQALADKIREKTLKLGRYAASPADAVEGAVAVAEDGDMILTLGAGSVSQLGPLLLERLKQREAVTS